jgi:hypothetical protein
MCRGRSVELRQFPSAAQRRREEKSKRANCLGPVYGWFRGVRVARSERGESAAGGIDGLRVKFEGDDGKRYGIYGIPSDFLLSPLKDA